MINGIRLNSGCDYFSTVDAELVVYNSRDNHTVVLDGALAILMQTIRNSGIDCVLSETKLHKLLQSENVELDDASLSTWIGKLIDLQLIFSTD
jgi:hypothetical protein